MNMAHWSSGQDIALSRRNQEFDSPMGHQKEKVATEVVAFFVLLIFNYYFICFYKQ